MPICAEDVDGFLADGAAADDEHPHVVGGEQSAPTPELARPRRRSRWTTRVVGVGVVGLGLGHPARTPAGRTDGAWLVVTQQELEALAERGAQVGGHHDLARWSAARAPRAGS